MKRVYCLDCDSAIQINASAKVGDEIVCENCEAEFELVSLNPPVIEWLYDDDEEWDEYNDDSEDDSEDDWEDDEG